MGLFRSIAEAFNSVTDSISSAFSTIREQVHDVFYSPQEYITTDVTITPAKHEDYELWLIEQTQADIGAWSFFHELFDEKRGTP